MSPHKLTNETIAQISIRNLTANLILTDLLAKCSKDRSLVRTRLGADEVSGTKAQLPSGPIHLCVQGNSCGNQTDRYQRSS